MIKKSKSNEIKKIVIAELVATHTVGYVYYWKIFLSKNLDSFELSFKNETGERSVPKMSPIKGITSAAEFIDELDDAVRSMTNEFEDVDNILDGVIETIALVYPEFSCAISEARNSD